MKTLKSVGGINIIALLLYSISIRLVHPRDLLSAMGFTAYAVGIHVLICVLLGLVFLVQKDNEFGRAWLQSAGLVLLIGFSVCLGNLAI